MNEPKPLVVLPSTRRQAHVADVSSTLAGIAGALAQLQLAGAPPDAAIGITNHGYTPRVTIAADWTES